MDPLLLLAALGLAACSFIMLKGEGRSLDPANPMYFAERQAVYFGIGLVLALLLGQIDYSRLREYKYGLYGLMIALNVVVLAMPHVQGAARRSAAVLPAAALRVRQGAADRVGVGFRRGPVAQAA